MTKLYHYLAAALLITLTGCSATTSPGGTQTSGSMVATVNGQAWSSTVVPLVSGGATGIKDTATNTLIVTGISASLSRSTETIAIALIHPHLGADSLGTGNTGSYLIGTSGAKYVTVGFGAGYINITKYDVQNKLISGTFNFTAHQTDTLSHVVTITGGSFVDVGWTVH